MNRASDSRMAPKMAQKKKCVKTQNPRTPPGLWRPTILTARSPLSISIPESHSSKTPQPTMSLGNPPKGLSGPAPRFLGEKTKNGILMQREL